MSRTAGRGRVRGWAAVGLLLLGACADGGDPAPCDALGDAGLEVAPADVEFGAFTPGDPLLYGNPPQGGAPFSPFHARVTGVPDLDEGATLNLHAVDPTDDALLGDTTYELRLVCANVGDSAGQWLGTDLHQRFDGWSLDDLAGRTMHLTLTVENAAGDHVEAALEGLLTLM